MLLYYNKKMKFPLNFRDLYKSRLAAPDDAYINLMRPLHIVMLKAASDALYLCTNKDNSPSKLNCHQQLNIKNYRPNCSTVVQTIF